MISKAQSTKIKIGKLDYIKIKNFVHQRQNQQSKKKTFANHIYDNIQNKWRILNIQQQQKNNQPDSEMGKEP